jgi:hypothetical protein
MVSFCLNRLSPKPAAWWFESKCKTADKAMGRSQYSYGPVFIAPRSTRRMDRLVQCLTYGSVGAVPYSIKCSALHRVHSPGISYPHRYYSTSLSRAQENHLDANPATTDGLYFPIRFGHQAKCWIQNQQYSRSKSAVLYQGRSKSAQQECRFVPKPLSPLTLSAPNHSFE